MTADNPDDFPYVPVEETEDSQLRKAYWDIAKGLQKVDGLETSSYLEQLESEHVDGKRSIEETGRILREYYKASSGNGAQGPTSNSNAELPSAEASGEQGDTHLDSQREADLVSQRIVELLSNGAFLLDSSMLNDIHKHLFQDLDAATYMPGSFKEAALQKQEEILNGDSVLYADPSVMERALAFAFDEERAYVYDLRFDSEQIEHLGRFLSRIWQVHPFAEGNTRTVAVFATLYLNNLGFDIDNEPFKANAAYFRNALVRANYRNAKAGVVPDSSFLDMFFENLLSNGSNELDSNDLRIQALFDDPQLLRNVSPALALEK